MKLGLLSTHPNCRYEPGKHLISNATHLPCTLGMLYPDELYCDIYYEEPDFAWFSELDAVLYLSATGMDYIVVDYIKDIPCKVIVCPDGHYSWFSRWAMQCIKPLLVIMDIADLIVLPDTRSSLVSVFNLLTSTKLLIWRYPYPVNNTLDVLSRTNDAPQYDIVLPHGPFRSQNSFRNGYIAAVAAQRIIDNVDGFNSIGIFNRHSPQYEVEAGKDSLEILNLLGCRDYTLIQNISVKDYLCIIAKAKMMLNLDYSPSIGRVANDCALARIPYIGTSIPNNAYYIYHDIYTQEPFDVVSPTSMAFEIAAGRWYQSWLDLAYERALRFNVSDAAVRLEKAVRELCG